MADRRKDIPTPNAGNFDARMREEMMRGLGRQGDKRDRFVTIGDLAESGVVTLRPGWQNSNEPPVLGPGPGPGSGGPPPAPTGFEAEAGITRITISHDAPGYVGHRRTLVFGKAVAAGDPLPTFGNAQLLMDFAGTVAAYPTEPATTWRLWIKWQNQAGLIGPAAGGINGLEVRTGEDVRKLLDALTAAAEDPTSPYTKLALRADLLYVASATGPTDASLFSVVTTPITNNGVTVPVGVYMRDLFVMNGTITNAKIANLAVDNAKIANVSVAKLTAGAVAVGEYIQSTGFISGSSGQGWRIDGAGNIEASNAIIRGTVVATSGSIGGIVIEANAIRSTNYTAGGSGFRLGADGTLRLPSGSVDAAALNIGVGANLVNNSGFSMGLDYWGFTDSIGGLEYGHSFANYTLLSSNTAYLYCPNANYAGVDMNVRQQDIYSEAFPVIGGQRYEFSAYTGAHRCIARTYILFYDGAGNGVGGIQSTADNNQEAAGGGALVQYKRLGGFSVAPAGAVTARVLIRKSATVPGQANSFLFVCWPFAGVASDGQTTLSPYAPSGIGVKITPTGISTPNLSALSAVIGLLRTAASGQRMELDNNTVRSYDFNNVLRARMGIW